MKARAENWLLTIIVGGCGAYVIAHIIWAFTSGNFNRFLEALQ